MLCFPLRLFNVPALAVGLVLYYTLSLDSINLIPNPKCLSNSQPPSLLKSVAQLVLTLQSYYKLAW